MRPRRLEVVAVMLLRRDSRQYQAAIAAALLLMCWCGFELIFMFNFAAVGYFVVGMISALSALWLLRGPKDASV